MAGKGILSRPNVKPDKVLRPATAEIVKKFYVSDEISNIMPGPKNYVPINFVSKKFYLQKKLFKPYGTET
jgi:hypothetical protein